MKVEVKQKPTTLQCRTKYVYNTTHTVEDSSSGRTYVVMVLTSDPATCVDDNWNVWVSGTDYFNKVSLKSLHYPVVILWVVGWCTGTKVICPVEGRREERMRRRRGEGRRRGGGEKGG